MLAVTCRTLIWPKSRVKNVVKLHVFGFPRITTVWFFSFFVRFCCSRPSRCDYAKVPRPLTNVVSLICWPAVCSEQTRGGVAELDKGPSGFGRALPVMAVAGKAAFSPVALAGTDAEPAQRGNRGFKRTPRVFLGSGQSRLMWPGCWQL